MLVRNTGTQEIYALTVRWPRVARRPLLLTLVLKRTYYPSVVILSERPGPKSIRNLWPGRIRYVMES